MTDRTGRRKIDFAGISRAAAANGDLILRQWLPGGRMTGGNWLVSNPKRKDETPSLCVNARTGAWLDYAGHGQGGDFISLAAYLFDLSQSEAAERLAAMLGVSAYV